MTSLYSRLIAPSIFKVSEEKVTYEYVTERHLQAVWLEQKYFYPLFSLEGQSIQVISPGIWNTDAGPDFLKAHLIIDGIDTKGDVEIHLTEDGWSQHGHHEDKRYNDVILHISLWPSTRQRKIIKENGNSPVQTILEPFLTIPISKILKFLDLELYPYKKFLGSGKCAKTLFNELEDKKVEELFKAASLWRLKQKFEFLSYRIEDSNDLILGGIARTLGFKHNADPFLDLFLFLKQCHHHSFDDMLSLALGTCGFFEERFQMMWMDSEKYRFLFSIWGGIQFEADHQSNLALTQIRPFNHPVRRLVYLVHLLNDQQAAKIGEYLEYYWNTYSERELNPKLNKEIIINLMNVTPGYADEYWNTHYLFEVEKEKKVIPLIGGDLKREILVNVYLPYLYSKMEDMGNYDGAQKISQFFHTIPASRTGKAKYLVHRFFGETPKGTLLLKADCEQGAYQMHKDFCRHYEASCVGCPFVERYKSSKT